MHFKFSILPAVLTLFLHSGCLSQRNPTSSNNNLEIISAKQNSYFPGTGIGRGTRYEIQFVNHSNNPITIDSIRTSLYCVPFDGKKNILPNDTLIAFAFGLTVDTANFPDFPPTPFTGDTTLAQRAIIFYTSNQKGYTKHLASIKEVQSEFFE